MPSFAASCARKLNQPGFQCNQIKASAAAFVTIGTSRPMTSDGPPAAASNHPGHRNSVAPVTRLAPVTESSYCRNGH